MIQQLGIIGAGESGVAAALLAQDKSWNVFVSDYGIIAPHYKKELEEVGIEFEEGMHDLDRLKQMDLIVKSPGVSSKVKIIQELIECKVSIVSEIDFASLYFDGVIIAITGSNGKTTTSSLIYEIFAKAGKDCCLAGNIGTAFARAVKNKKYDYAILEVSSFQLEDLQNFHPKVAVLTNITEDHLDRYEYDIDKYAQAKMNITFFQTSDDHLIYNLDDHITGEILSEGKFLPMMIGLGKNDFSQYLHDARGKKYQYNIVGTHNEYNISMAVCVARYFEISDNAIREALLHFQPIEHRMELVLEHMGIKYINDSKATNVDSVYYALEGINGKIIWIVGGVDKGNDYSVLLDLVLEKVKQIIILSKHPENIIAAFGATGIPIWQTEETKSAVEYANRHAESEDYVLLSPACASFDLYSNYEERGNQFKQQVKNLKSS